MSKLFAFIPTAQWGIDAARETLIRFGHSKHGVEKFTGPLEPLLPLLMCVPVKDGQEASFKLKQISVLSEVLSRISTGFLRKIICSKTPVSLRAQPN